MKIGTDASDDISICREEFSNVLALAREGRSRVQADYQLPVDAVPYAGRACREIGRSNRELCIWHALVYSRANF